MSHGFHTLRVFALTVVACAAAGAAGAQVGDISAVTYPGWIPSDRVVPVITQLVTYDQTTSRWRYSYIVVNDRTAEQDLLELQMNYNGSTASAAAPPGWFEMVFDPDVGGIAGATFRGIPDDPSPYPEPPSPAQIRPGGTLGGFTLVSAYPPGYARTFAKGFAGVPPLSDSLAAVEADTRLPDDSLNSRRGWAIAPTRYLKVVTGGNRRPATDGFLGFMNLAESGSTVRSPAPVALKFSLKGETVFRETLRVTLNGVDVTTSFHPGPPDGADLVALFEVGSSPLTPGKNVLVTSVEGLTANGQRGTDSDRITFTVDANRLDPTNSLLNDPTPDPGQIPLP